MSAPLCIYYRLYDLKKSVQLIVAYPVSTFIISTVFLPLILTIECTTVIIDVVLSTWNFHFAVGNPYHTTSSSIIINGNVAFSVQTQYAFHCSGSLA